MGLQGWPLILLSYPVLEPAELVCRTCGSHVWSSDWSAKPFVERLVCAYMYVYVQVYVYVYVYACVYV